MDLIEGVSSGPVDDQGPLQHQQRRQLCQLLMAVAEENGLLDCLLCCDWTGDEVPKLAEYLSDMASCGAGDYEETHRDWLRHLRLRPWL